MTQRHRSTENDAKRYAALRVVLCASVSLCQIAVSPCLAQQTQRRIPALSSELLAESKTRIKAHDARLMPAYNKLIREADSTLTVPLVAVTDKHTLLPPSNDKHDYFSLSPYWWPDTTKKDGLPYIRRDGVTNPESKRDLDQPRVAALGWNLQTLALAYYFTGDEKYAKRASQQLHRWFLDDSTKMNPHLRYAQLVRGNPAERGSGIIDTRWFIEAVQAASLIEGSKSWSKLEREALQWWFKKYLTWLQESPNGAHERAAKNNHGSWYAAQTAAYAMYLGETKDVRAIVDSAKMRIGWQIKPDGSQPEEMVRTRSLHYSAFNIEALSRVAEMGHVINDDLWHYSAPTEGSLKRAIDHVARYLGTNEKWPGEQIDPVEMDLMVIHLRRAERRVGGEIYKSALQRLPKKLVAEDRSALLYPDPK